MTRGMALIFHHIHHVLLISGKPPKTHSDKLLLSHLVGLFFGVCFRFWAVQIEIFALFSCQGQEEVLRGSIDWLERRKKGKLNPF